MKLRLPESPVATFGVAQKQNAVNEQGSVGTFRDYVGLRLWLPDSPVVSTRGYSGWCYFVLSIWDKIKIFIFDLMENHPYISSVA
ncbi:hypothetical protein TSAR_015475 [Trichomalopsis sarcophagae]|uniref:Uncharacterized protein n=1 Tax=Trichomalopsis sarcophagae TaxID=543379 RepID=A0A232FA36_9HYME|nr:hypothetical protein TSAR_015475 [Trichomalopsis sarcophagae]